MKLAILTALLLLALSMAEAASGESCRREMSRRSLDKCRSFVRSGSRQQGMLMGFEDVEEEDMEAPRMCCEQLGQVREECRCSLIRKMMQQMAEEEGFQQGGEEECRGRCGEMMMRAKYLPAMCEMSPRTCRMSSAGGKGGMME